jgi:hypothetical protein
LIFLLSINILCLVYKLIKVVTKKDFLNEIYQKLLLLIEIKEAECYKNLAFLYKHNLIILIWYFVLFISILILCIISWHEVNELSFTHPTKDTALFILLIIFVLLPFGNMEILGIKVTSNKPLNNNEAIPIPDKISSDKEKTIKDLKQQWVEICRLKEDNKNAK